MKKVFSSLFFCILVMLSGQNKSSGDAEVFETSVPTAEQLVGIFPPEVKTIACIAPGSHPGRPLYQKGIKMLRKAGYRVKVMPHAFVRQEKEARAPLEGRLADFYQAWNDPEVDMILCIRGGFGSIDVIDHIDWSKLKKRPELYFQGYSDITVIVSALLKKGYGHPVAGPSVGSIVGLAPDSVAAMKKIHHGEQLGPIKLETLVPGDCQGLPLAGLIHRFRLLVDKEYCPDTKGRIIFLEAVGTDTENIRSDLEYMLKHKFFEGAAAVVFCQFARCRPEKEIEPLIREFAPKLGVPVYKGFPFGHTARIYPVDFSRPAEIRNGEIVFPAVKK